MTDHDLALLYRLQVRELADFALFMINPEGRISSWNRGVEHTFGYSEDEWLGLHANTIFTEEDRQVNVAHLEMKRASEEGRADDIRWHLRKDGSRVYLTGVLLALRNDNGDLIGYSKVVYNDTPRKMLEDALTRSNSDLQQFAFTASHDLQTPLRMLSALAETMRQRYTGKLDEDADQILRFMIQSAQRMSKLVSDLLEFSQLSGDTAGASSVHLDEDLETAISLLKSEIERSGAAITHDSLPDVRLDRNQMVRLFQNLIGNAIKFQPEGNQPKVHVSAERQDKHWLIRVIDNGIGFPPEETEKIFAPFARLHSQKEYPGSGIGLAACKRIVESYGGRIGAESNPGHGSSFWFTVPDHQTHAGIEK